MQNTETTPALALDSTELSLSDYRSLREGREVPKNETPSAIDTEAAPAEVVEETAAEAEAAEDTEEPKLEDKPKPKGDKLSARFSELTAKIRTLETQLSQKANGPTEAPKPADAPAPEPEPVPEKFENYVDWQKAYIKWELRQEARQQETARQAAEARTAEAARAHTWQERVTEAKAELTDFATVAQNPDLPVSKVMGEAIVESEIGPKILYHLGQHPDEAARIAKLSPVAQVREIGRLEAKLEAPAAAPEAKEPPVKKPVVSKAPAPIKPVGGGAVSANPAKNLEGMSQAEYRALRESGRLR